VRVLNITAKNFRIIDKESGKPIGKKHVQKIDKDFDFSEAMRTEDVLAIVDHINSCNRHAYRVKYGKEPPRDYIEIRVNSDYYESTENIKCPQCGFVISYRKKDLPLRVVCPRCGKDGMIR